MSRYLNLTTLVGVLVIVGGLVAGDRGWIGHDTSAQLVSLGLYAIARRKTEARRLELLQAICHGVNREPSVPRPPTMPRAPR